MRLAYLGRAALGAGLSAVLAFAACAKGADETSDPNDDGPEGGAGGTAGAAGMVDPGGMGGVGGVPVPCDEDPCKLTLPQCGCAADEMCGLHPVGGVQCMAIGMTPLGENCVAGGCEPGHVCVNNNTGAPPFCHKFCDDDMDCSGPGALCVLEIGTEMLPACSQNCDPVSSVGCDAPNTKCDLAQHVATMTFFTRCVGEGNFTQNEICNSSWQCQIGMGCFNITGQMERECLTWCNLDNPVCPTMTNCGPLNPPVVIGTVTYGACN